MAGGLILTAVALVSSSAVLYAFHLHRSLSLNIKHSGGVGLLKVDDDNETIIESLPPDLADPSKYYIIHDFASKRVPSAKLPTYGDPNQLLTRYLRRNMTCFAKTPQALLLRLVFKEPEARKTFDASFIQGLDFVPGDVVCGAYRVAVRTANKVEFAMVPLEGFPPVDGRLVTSIQPNGDQTLFVTETLQWKRREEKVVLPLERKSMKWLHELVSWWLLETGTRWLCDSGPEH